jgi:hypothetical protein
MRPRFAARRRIPAAAREESEYFGDTLRCRTADKLTAEGFGLCE